ncbi:Matrix-remodeling-associated protein 5 [Holothuria leucospilota]|uniref:Matrix-remodeling-associated protein 5 n=1 Tax=Holothuria leucospilota TaxID=206669 RepID=A0A9Q1HES2_HOLLE|nr:Matrix-remodeling-associated protein 5 [Holothuria leucospilota]
MEGTYHLRFLFFPCLFICSPWVHTPNDAYDIVAKNGETVHVKCIYNLSLGNIENIVWFHNENRLMIHDSSIENHITDRYYPVLPLEKSSATLKILDVRFGDAGVYSCMQYFKTGRSVKYHSKLQVTGSPIIEMTRKTWTEDESVFSMCCADTALKPEGATIVWSINGEIASSSSTFASRNSNEDSNYYTFCSNVTFLCNRFQNGKILQCSVLGGINSSTSVTLNILYAPRIKYKGTLPGRRQTVIAGNNKSVNISCILEGNPKPEVYLEKKISPNMWGKLPQEPFTTDSDDGILTMYTFTITLFSEQDTGNFRCIANNGIGPELSSTDIHVKFKSDVAVNIVILTSKQLYVGDTFSISCIAQGYPNPSVQLEKIMNEEQWVKLPIKPEISHQSPKFTSLSVLGMSGVIQAVSTDVLHTTTLE